MYSVATDITTCLPVGQSIGASVRKNATTYCNGGINFIGDKYFNTDPSSYTFQSVVAGTENNDIPVYTTSRRCGFPISVAKATGSCGSIQTGPNNFYYMRRFCACDAPVDYSTCPTFMPTSNPTKVPISKPSSKPSSKPTLIPTLKPTF
jgi:hypothetical protein